ncbi:hypothetical protein DE146DRAFT_780783 [Phaeosphaeria sp. MPI-PUGE-AT-0046c]|nr:hypothetical protein DE146DRAFT_780783 [Phaeosphaeria sp. MPI-PUGE-AT-0046c]
MEDHDGNSYMAKDNRTRNSYSGESTLGSEPIPLNPSTSATMTKGHIISMNAPGDEHSAYPVDVQMLATGQLTSIHNHYQVDQSNLNLTNYEMEQDAYMWHYDGPWAQPEAMHHTWPYRLPNQVENSQTLREWRGETSGPLPDHDFEIPQNLQSVTPRPLVKPNTGSNDASHDSPTHSPTLNDTPAHVPTCIGTINTTNHPKRFTLECIDTGCGGCSFRRMNNFARHYLENHVAEKTVFWCTVSGCDRSIGSGDWPFKRKASMVDHQRRVHGFQ